MGFPVKIKKIYTLLDFKSVITFHRNFRFTISSTCYRVIFKRLGRQSPSHLLPKSCGVYKFAANEEIFIKTTQLLAA